MTTVDREKDRSQKELAKPTLLLLEFMYSTTGLQNDAKEIDTLMLQVY